MDVRELDYVDTIILLCRQPPQAPYWDKEHGYLIDGGYSDLQLTRGTFVCWCQVLRLSGLRTRRLFPSTGRADVKPSRYVPLTGPLPPPFAGLFDVCARRLLFPTACNHCTLGR
jgi:hypothetical protein